MLVVKRVYRSCRFDINAFRRWHTQIGIRPCFIRKSSHSIYGCFAVTMCVSSTVMSHNMNYRLNLLWGH